MAKVALFVLEQSLGLIVFQNFSFAKHKNFVTFDNCLKSMSNSDNSAVGKLLRY